MDFEAIIKEQREELEFIEKQEHLISREKFNEAKNILKYPNILAVLGVRRCGKSTFSYLLVKDKNFGYINFDDERLQDLKAEDLNEILKTIYKLYNDVEYIVLDEIQNIQGWELFVTRLRRTKKVILTGSNSNLLSGELSTHLTGRHINIVLYPFSFKEFLLFHNFKINDAYTTSEKAKLLSLLDKYLQDGGFPEVQKFGSRILLEIYDDILTKDIIIRYKIKKVPELKKFAKYLITNVAQELSYTKLSKLLEIQHVSTISKWVNYFEDSFLFFKLEKFDFKLKQQFLSPKKIYCVDIGLLNKISFKFSKNQGKLMENIVAVSLKQKFIDDTEIYYWKDYHQNEVDFIIKEGTSIKQLIQVTYATSKEEINDREIFSLIRASKELKCNNLLIITWDYENIETINGYKIKYVPLWKWLLI